MKKAIIVFILAAMVLFTAGLWIFPGSDNIKPTELISLGVIVLVVAFAVFTGYKRLASAKKGEPPEDELSKKVMQKTSSLSFYISLYLWLIIMYLSDKTGLATHTLIGVGILSMAVTFGICWVIINFRGIKNE
jgi:peptidoglycan/LPS O-acetylase OafA/YrhL